ncbi:CHAT domain-containing protein [Nocardia sp. NPDC004340]
MNGSVHENKWVDRAARWEEDFIRGRAAAVMSDIRAGLRLAEGIDRAYLLANLANYLVSHHGAAAPIDRMLSEATALLDDAHAPDIRGTILAAKGLHAINAGANDQALLYLADAEKQFRDSGNSIRTARVQINRAIALMELHRGDESLALLDEAETALSTLVQREFGGQFYQGVISVNRASVFTSVGRNDLALTHLLRAKDYLVPLGSTKSVGLVWLNLAILYKTECSHVSTLEAARNAAQVFEEFGDTDSARRSQVLEAGALRELGQLNRATEIITEMLAVWDKSANDAPPIWVLEGLDEYTKILRWSGKLLEQERIEKILADLSSRSPFRSPEFTALDAWMPAFTAWMGALDDKTKSRAWDEMRRLIGQIREVRVDGEAAEVSRARILIADVFEGVSLAVKNGAVDEALERRITDLAGEFSGYKADLLRSASAMLAGAAGFSVGNKNQMLRWALAELYLRQRTSRSLEDEQYRARFITASSDLINVLDLVMQLQDWECLGEVIEFVRTDQARINFDVSGDLEIAMPSFRSLLDPSVPAPVENLSLPVLLSVKGTSKIGKSVGKSPEADLGHIREAWAGEDSSWLAHLVVGDRLYWSYATRGSHLGGAVDLDVPVREALTTYADSLPLSTARDRNLLARDNAPEWCVQVTAVARSARSAMVADEIIVEHCLDSLPRALKKKVMRYLDTFDDSDLDSALACISSLLIPPVVRDALLKHPDHRLVLSPDAQFSSIPYPLLPLARDVALVDVSALQLIPPAGAVDRALRVPHRPASRHLLSVRNPVGDLHYVPTPIAEDIGVILAGRNNIAAESELATPAHTLAALDGLAAEGLFSYIGHIRAGNAARPGSAALLLASTDPLDQPTPLSAKQILASKVRMPSRVYLGGCEGTGFGTGLEWASVASVALIRGASCVLAHAWPIIDHPSAGKVDQTCIETLLAEDDPAVVLRAAQRRWLQQWRSDGSGVAPHWWAGLQYIGRSGEHLS